MSLICIPITLTGLLVAHSLAYALVTRSEADAHALLATTGHGYLSLAHTLVLSVGAGLVATGVLLRLRSGRGGAWRAGWAVAAPVLAFAVQEHVERLAHDGSFPSHLLLEPVFLIGLALQIPFGLLAVILARSLLVLRGHRPRRDQAPVSRSDPGPPEDSPLAGAAAGANGAARATGREPRAARRPRRADARVLIHPRERTRRHVRPRRRGKRRSPMSREQRKDRM